jgi:glycosyltransferase involved in cell wall biosynthesis
MLSEIPSVSCIMPTGNRPDYVEQAIRLFQQQDYPHRELIILDDGQEPASGIPFGESIRYERISKGMTIGAKRNHALELARGQFIAHWDDDDWYAPSRLSTQLAPLLSGAADITALSDCLFLDLAHWEFWSCAEKVFQRMFVGNVHGGTLVYRRSIFEDGVRYPHVSRAEDAHFLYSAHRRGARLQGISGQDLFIYVRHATNAWQFTCGKHVDPFGWIRVAEPELPAFDRNFLLARAKGESAKSAGLPQ